MNLLHVLENGLFALGQVLRFPVMALLWVCVVVSLFMAGRCVVDFVARRRERHSFDLDLWLKLGPALDTTEARHRALPFMLRQLLCDVEASRAEDTLGNGGLEHL